MMFLEMCLHWPHHSGDPQKHHNVAFIEYIRKTYHFIYIELNFK